MSVNEEEIPILVIYFTKTRIIYETEFGSFSKFGALIDFFNSKISSDSIKLKKKYLLNNKEIKEDDLLIDLIQVYAVSKKIISATFSIELDEIYNIGDEEIQSYKKILQPKSDNFGLYVFIPESGSLSLEEYPTKIIKYFNLEKINKASAFCNTHNSLFISGGMYNNEEIQDFWIIDNKNYRIEKKEMPYPKSSHSMIYIENNNKKLIFFVGGNDSKCFYYDIVEKKFEPWGNINSPYINPSLIQIENYLYCFELTLAQKNQIFFEKTKLDGDSHSWEKEFPDFESEQLKDKILFKNFCVSKCAGKKIMFICDNDNSGNLNEENVFLYDIETNLFYLNKICSNQYVNFRDKTFYKINNSHSIILPDFSNENGIFEIGILNKIKYTFRKIKLNPCKQNQINFKKYKNIRDEISNIGKILVEFKTEESNQDSENNINESNKNENNLQQFILNIDSNKINSEKNIPTMINSKLLDNRKGENELENNEDKHEEENLVEEDMNIMKNKEEEINGEVKKEDDYIIYDNNEVDNVDKHFNEENEIEDSLNKKLDNEDNNNNNEGEENNDIENLDRELYSDVDNGENEEEIERDKFELTLTQPIGEDIIQIENYPLSKYDPDCFCDYNPQ